MGADRDAGAGSGAAFVPQLADFAGEWRIERQIVDRRAAQILHFAGRARFAPEGAGLRYREEGRLVLADGSELVATRDYLWRRMGARIAVTHADGSAFHVFDPAAPEARHACGPDDYRVRYDFGRWPDWRAEWTVTGPRKDYTTSSLYRR